MPRSRVDILTAIHKGLRRALYEMTRQIGAVGLEDDEVLAVAANARQVMRMLREHGEDEERVLIPALVARAPEPGRGIAEQHTAIPAKIERLLGLIDALLESPARSDDRAQAGLRLYRYVNGFVRYFLAHLDAEEEQLTEAFRRHFSDEELVELRGRFLATLSGDRRRDWLLAVLPALNPTERLEVVQSLYRRLDADGLKALVDTAREALGGQEWSDLATRIEL